MQIQLDADGYITGFSTIGSIENGIAYFGEVPTNFLQDYMFYRYDIEQDRLVFDQTRKQRQTQLEQISQRIMELKQCLACSDYQTLKFAEGQLNEQEFFEMREKRKQYRKEINLLEERLGEIGEMGSE